MSTANVGGVWRNLTDVKANIGSVWRQIENSYANINAVWKEVWTKMYAYSSDLCTGGTPIASSGSGNPALAFDNKASTVEYYWYSRYYGPQTVGYDYIGYTFSSTKTIKKIRIYTIADNNHAISSIKLQAFVGAWTDVQTISLNAYMNGWQEFLILANVSSNQWRILANSYNDYWYVGEIEMMEIIG